MTLADLHETCSRLLADPRCSPTTPVELGYEYETQINYTDDNREIEWQTDVAPVACVAISNAHGGRSVVLSTRNQDNAIAR